MPKLRPVSGREACRILEAHGFIFVRQKGSHRIMQKRLPATTITVPIPDHKELKLGTLRSIIRQAGISPDAFRA